MSNQEIAKSMIDKLPDDKIIYIINILEYSPNKETIATVEEVDQMVKNGTGEHYNGSTSDFFANMLGE